MSLKNWYRDPNDSFFVPDPRGRKSSREMVFIYAFQLAIWTYSGIRHRFFEVRRNDYFMMFVHHIVTMILELMSFGYDYTAYGLLIMLIHESSDIFVEIVKIFNHLHSYHKEGYYLAEGSFITNLFVWFIVRLVIFPRSVFIIILLDFCSCISLL